MIESEGKEIAAAELHPGRYLHHAKTNGVSYKPMLQGLVDKADQLKVIVFFYKQNISIPTKVNNDKLNTKINCFVF